MKFIILFLSLIFSHGTYACSCSSNCLARDYDIAATIEVTKINNTYSGAYDAKVSHLHGWNEELLFKGSPFFNLITKETDEIIVVKNGVHPLNVQSINSCSRSYEIGQKLMFFAKEVKPGFYQSDQCSCTTILSK